MATAKTSPKTSEGVTPAPVRPTAFELDQDDPRFVTIMNSQRGRTAAPSVFASEVETAAGNLGKYYAIDASTAYPTKVIVRELKKANRTWNKDNPDAQIQIVCHERTDHPTMADFVAYHAEPAPVTTDTSVTE